MSRQSFTIAGAVVLGSSLACLAAPPLSGVRIAAVRNGAVCASVDGSALRCFGGGSSMARLPVWSRDGTRIAYIDEAQATTALVWLVVIDQHGQEQSRIPVKPVADGEVRSGMRFAESLEWLGNDRVVVTGTINPSSTESIVFDLLRSTAVGEYVDDARGASFSPDGKHVLLVDGAPHFTAPSTRAPVLRLNGREVLKGFHADLGSAGPVRWSADGTHFALTAHDTSRQLRLVLGSVPTGSARWVNLPFAPPEGNKPPALFWSGSELHMQRSSPAVHQARATPAPGARNVAIEDQVLNADQRTSTWRRSAAPAIDPVRAAAEIRSAELRSPLAAGVQDADVWCTGCVLDKVARRHGADADAD